MTRKYRSGLLLWACLLTTLLVVGGCAAPEARPLATPTPSGTPSLTQPLADASPTATVAPNPLRLGAPRGLLELSPSVGSDYLISPDGKWVSYREPPHGTSGSRIEPGGLVARNLETGQTVPLVDSPRANRHAWFPDSRGVIVVVGPGDGQPGEILAKALGQAPLRSVVKPPSNSFGFEEAVVSPDGRRLAFTILYEAGAAPVPKIGIEVMALDGSGRRQIVEPDFFVGRLAWSPDGRQAVYFQGKGGTPPDDGEAYGASVEVPAPPRLLLPRKRLVTWSPDGRQALWATEPMDRYGNADLLVTGWPDLGEPRLIARSASAFGADWAGSGDWITYAQEGSIYLTAAQGGSSPLRLTTEGEQATTPLWLPGKGIAYGTVEGATLRVRLLPLHETARG